ALRGPFLVGLLFADELAEALHRRLPALALVVATRCEAGHVALSAGRPLPLTLGVLRGLAQLGDLVPALPELRQLFVALPDLLRQAQPVLDLDARHLRRV